MELIWKDKASGAWANHMDNPEHYFDMEADYTMGLFEEHGQCLLIIDKDTVLCSSDCLQAASKKYKRAKSFKASIKHAQGTLRQFIKEIGG